MFNSIKKIFTSFIIFVVFPIILVGVFTSRTSFLFGIRSYLVPTGSMVPTLPIGSVIFTMPEPSYHIGDIITFQRGNIDVTHRIIEIKNGEFQTKGDANKVPDIQYVLRGNIIGKDIIILPYLGRFVSYLKTIPGFIIFVAIPILLFIFSETLIIKNEWEKILEKRIITKINEAQEQ